MTPEEHDALEAQLRELARLHDPVPDDVTVAAELAFSMRSLDAELADLAYDSLLDEPVLAGVRGSGSRQLSFEASGLSVEVEVATGVRHRLVGQVVPARPGTIEVRHPGGTITTRVDDLGRFTVTLPAGPFSIRCPAGADGRPVETAWVPI